MAGAVDLSGLKQRAQQKASATASASRATSAARGTDGPENTSVTEITEVNFEDEVLVRSNEVPVVVLVWSPRSDACVKLFETLSGLAAADGAWSLATVNVDEAPQVAQIFGVDAVPTVVALAAGQPLSSFQGVQPADQLRRWINSLLSVTASKLRRSPAGSEDSAEIDPAVAQARQQLEAGDFVAAKRSYQAIVDANPASVEAKAAIRQIDFLTRATAQRSDAVAVADAAPGDIAAAFAAADVQILNRDMTAAFDRLIALLRSTSGDERSSIRTRLIELFELFDPADPDVIASRRNLANALY
ncbi:co-chaperone YbbN [Mycobacterium uberis]|uniref:Co-chaperone YbbN n=2 Tax=Mycobacterium uberis TaxID=2162698 RepID=A0A3E1HJD9_9MYCO|nr:co-chaperone YbbN [Mycobacterium uberis]